MPVACSLAGSGLAPRPHSSSSDRRATGAAQGLIWLLAAWVGVMILCSLGYYAAERGVNEAVTQPLDALWWGIVTMTTVGYGDVYPVTS